MLEREYIVERIKSLPEDALKEVIDFIEFLEAKRKRSVEEGNVEGDPLARVIGICEGPSDLAERHDKYVYVCINRIFSDYSRSDSYFISSW